MSTPRGSQKPPSSPGGKHYWTLREREINFCIKPPILGDFIIAAKELPSLIQCGTTEAKKRDYFKKEGVFDNVK